MLKTVLLALICMALGACQKPEYRKMIKIGARCNDGTPAFVASLPILLVESDEFIDRCVFLKGYMGNNALGGSHLFLTRDHALINDRITGIDLADDTQGAEIFESTCNNHYVQIIGKLTLNDDAIMYLLPDHIWRYDLAKEKKTECWKRLVGNK